MKKPGLRIEMVSWLDHCSTTGGTWQSLETIRGLTPPEVCSVGWLIKETPRWIIIVPTFHEEEGYGEILILKNDIIRRKRLK